MEFVIPALIFILALFIFEDFILAFGAMLIAVYALDNNKENTPVEEPTEIIEQVVEKPKVTLDTCEGIWVPEIKECL